MSSETFTSSQVRDAITSFLEFGESQNPGGYFSGPGWAARCLRWHLMELWAADFAGDYYDNCSNAQLAGFIDNQDELRRINNHWKHFRITQAELNAVLRKAIVMRVSDGQP